MDCEKCGRTMEYQYQVEERRMTFVLWHCECGHKFLERKRPTAGAVLSARAMK